MDHGTTEYSLAELVEDPLVGLLMKSDGVDRRNIQLIDHQPHLPKELFCEAHWLQGASLPCRRYAFNSRIPLNDPIS